MAKTRRLSAFLALVALVAIGVGAFVFTGCGREAPAPEKADSALNDPKFRSALKEKRTERKELAKIRDRLEAEMTALVEAKQKELKTDDRQAAVAALEKDPEWQSLVQRYRDVHQAIRESRGKAFGLVRGRLSPEKPANGKISK